MSVKYGTLCINGDFPSTDTLRLTDGIKYQPTHRRHHIQQTSHISLVSHTYTDSWTKPNSPSWLCDKTWNTSCKLVNYAKGSCNRTHYRTRYSPWQLAVTAYCTVQHSSEYGGISMSHVCVYIYVCMYYSSWKTKILISKVQHLPLITQIKLTWKAKPKTVLRGGGQKKKKVFEVKIRKHKVQKRKHCSLNALPAVNKTCCDHGNISDRI